MSPNDFQSIEILFLGWMLGISTSILWASVAQYREVKQRIKRRNSE